MADPTAPQTTPLFGVPVNQTPGPIQKTQPTQPQGVPKKHGTVDNILGFLGDFLTSRLRMGTPYRDARQAEKLNAARLADMQDPSQTFSQTGNFDPALAARLQGQATDDARLKASQLSVEEMRAARTEAAREKARADVLGRAAGYFNSLASDPKDIETRYAAGRQLWKNSGFVKNDPELMQTLEDMYPEKFDPAMITSSIGASVPVSTQWAQRLQANRDAATDADRDATRGERIRHNKVTEGQGADRVGIARSRAEIAGRPKPARAPRFTEGDIASGLIDRQAAGKPLTAGQRARVNKYVHGTSRPKAGDVVTLPDGRRVKLTK